MTFLIFLVCLFCSPIVNAHYLEPVTLTSPQDFYKKFKAGKDDLHSILIPAPKGQELKKFLFSKDAHIGKLFCKKGVSVSISVDKNGNKNEEVLIFQTEDKKQFCEYEKFNFSGDALFSLEMEPIEIRFGKDLDKSIVKGKIFLPFTSIYFRKEFLRKILKEMNINNKEFYGEGARFSSTGVIIFEPFQLLNSHFPAFTKFSFYYEPGDDKYYSNTATLPEGQSVRINGIPCKKYIDFMFEKVSYCTLSEDHSFGKNLNIAANTIVDLSFNKEKKHYTVHKFGPLGADSKILGMIFNKGDCGKLNIEDAGKKLTYVKVKCPAS